MGQQQNRGRTLVEAGIFLLILNVLVAAHFWEAISSHWQIEGEGLLLEQAWIRQGRTFASDHINFQTGYVYFLHFLFSFFGNHHSVAVGANITLQLLGIFLFYRGGRRLINWIVGLIFTAVMCVISIYDFPITEDSFYHLVWLICGLAFWLFSFGRPLYAGFRKRVADQAVHKEEEAEGKPMEEMMSKEEQTTQFTPIPNPLPLPKKHRKKEMDYGFEPPKELMHYDLNNYNVNDDYDLKEI